jgi:hypothetical protein
MNPTHSAGFHEPASNFAKDYYQKLLADPTTKNQPVLITGGGAGAGKTSGLALLKDNNHSLNDYAAINDTNLTTMKSAESRIQPALASGRPVRLLYTYRDPVDAFRNGVLPRANRTGRLVPIDAAAETHAGSLATIKQLVAKYKNNPNVDIQIADNSLGQGKAKLVSNPVDFLKNKSYNKNELKKVLQNELHQATNNHELNPNVANAYEQLGSEHSKQSELKKSSVASPGTKLSLSPKSEFMSTMRSQLKGTPAQGGETVWNGAKFERKIVPATSLKGEHPSNPAQVKVWEKRIQNGERLTLNLHRLLLKMHM